MYGHLKKYMSDQYTLNLSELYSPKDLKTRMFAALTDEKTKDNSDINIKQLNNLVIVTLLSTFTCIILVNGGILLILHPNQHRKHHHTFDCQYSLLNGSFQLFAK